MHHNPEVRNYFTEYEESSDPEMVVASAKTPLSSDVLGAFTSLKYIVQCSNGLNTIDLRYCKEKGIKIFNAPFANANAVSEYVVASVLSVVRKLILADRTIKSGKWEREKFYAKEVKDLKIGLIGFGNISKLVHKKLRAFDCSFLVVDPFLTAEQIEIDSHTKKVEHTELVSSADVISVHVPLLDATRNLLSEKDFSLMKNGCIVINSSRGGIVNEEDLIKHLKSGKLNAVLDVFVDEPNVDSRFFLDNVLLSPHIASMSSSAQENMITEAKENFERFLAEVKKE